MFSFVHGEKVSFLGFIFIIDAGLGRSTSEEFMDVSLIPLDSVQMSILFLITQNIIEIHFVLNQNTLRTAGLDNNMKKSSC